MASHYQNRYQTGTSETVPSVMSMQLKCEEEREDFLMATLNSYKEQLAQAQTQLLTDSTELTQHCSELIKLKGSYPMVAVPQPASKENQEILSMEADIQGLREMVSRLTKAKEDAIRNLKILQEDQAGSSQHDEDDAECSRLMVLETTLKEECRLLRKRLAQRRQRQWYTKTACANLKSSQPETEACTLGDSTGGTSSECSERVHSKTRYRGGESGQSTEIMQTELSNPQPALDEYPPSQVLNSINIGSSSKQRKITQHFPVTSARKHSSRFTFKTTGEANDFVPASDYPLSGDKRGMDNTDERLSRYSAPEINEPSDGSKDASGTQLMSQRPEDSYVIEPSTSSPQNHMRPAIGIKRLSSLPDTSPMEQNRTMEFVEARKEANKRHFMFLTNY